MNEHRRQLLLGYRDSLIVAYIIAACIGPMTFAFGLGRAFQMFLFSGFLFGTCFFALTPVRTAIRLPSFGMNLLAQTLATSATILIGGALEFLGGIVILGHSSPLDSKTVEQALGFFKQVPAAFIVVAGTLVAGIVNGFFAIDRKLGPGILWNWITGKYYNPTEEERIFMFLDLNDSTSLAEQLGNLKFSALIRDFFRDLTYPLLETRGEVSHYIGDEAVLTWKLGRGMEPANCVTFFFKMRNAIDARSTFYTNEYGFVPKFKAGIHVGKVVATEVGEIKSEIVFHGDVLNTAARIQGLCNQEGCPLLLSAEFAKMLPTEVTLRSLGMRQLKGKANEVEIYAVATA